jgi:hypothetical protein
MTGAVKPMAMIGLIANQERAVVGKSEIRIQIHRHKERLVVGKEACSDSSAPGTPCQWEVSSQIHRHQDSGMPCKGEVVNTS